MSETKICTKCGKEKPFTSEFFRRDNSRKAGFKGRCKECDREIFYSKEINTDISITKVCSSCKKEYPATMEYFMAGRKSKYGVSNTCRDCKSLYDKQYMENSPKKRIYNSQYMKNNRQKYNLINNKRKQLKNNTVNTLSAKDWDECMSFFDYKDAYTGIEMNIVSQDHVIPISKGGYYSKHNIVPCEKSVNSSKNNKDMIEWYKKQPFFSEERLSKILLWIGVKNNIQQLSIL